MILNHGRLHAIAGREWRGRFFGIQSTQSRSSPFSEDLRSRRARLPRRWKGETVFIVIVIAWDLPFEGTVGSIGFGGTGTSVESDESSGGVDGGLPASTWVEVFAETWQIGLGGRGMDGQPLWVVSALRGPDREQNTHVFSKSTSSGWSFSRIRI